MKLYLERSKCKIEESVNGDVLEVETDGPILVSALDETALMFDPFDSDGVDLKKVPTRKRMFLPYFTSVPKDYKL